MPRRLPYSSPRVNPRSGELCNNAQAVVSRSKTGRGKVTAPIFLLVLQVKLPKRLDLARDADRALGSKLIDDQSQNITVAARATAERKVFAHRS